MRIHIALALIPWLLCVATSAIAEPPIVWKACLAQPPEWYSSAAAVRIADSVLEYQLACGGWPKNVDMAAPLDDAARAKLRESRDEPGTIDNGATHTQIRFLARVAEGTGEARFREGVLTGIDFLLVAQYPSGGWPQMFPNPAAIDGTSPSTTTP